MNKAIRTCSRCGGKVISIGRYRGYGATVKRGFPSAQPGHDCVQQPMGALT